MMAEILCCTYQDTQKVRLEISYGQFCCIPEVCAWWYQFYLNFVLILYYCFQDF